MVTVRRGQDVSMSLSEFERERDAEVRRRIGLFGEGDRGAGAFTVGGPQAAISDPSAALAAAPAPGIEAELDDRALLADVRPGSGVVPALVRGRISGPLPPGSSVAIALNGSIRAVAPTYSDSGALRFGAMLPATAFRRGANRVALFQVGENGGLVATIRVGGAAPSSVRLQRTATGSSWPAGGPSRSQTTPSRAPWRR